VGRIFRWAIFFWGELPLYGGRLFDDNEGAGRKGDVAARVVVDADLPDRGAPADVKGFGFAQKGALAQAGDEVDLELDGDDVGAGGVAEVGGDAGGDVGEGGDGAPVDDPGGLEDFIADGEAEPGEAVAALDELDADVAVEEGSEALAELLADELWGPFPGHGWGLLSAWGGGACALAEDLDRDAAPLGGVGDDGVPLLFIIEVEDFGLGLRAFFVQPPDGDGRNVDVELEVFRMADADFGPAGGGAFLKLGAGGLDPAVGQDLGPAVFGQFHEKAVLVQHGGVSWMMNEGRLTKRPPVEAMPPGWNISI